ncbi:hypothetical protein GCM10023189_36440 [Nibrella saemangeumensis]|uniref:Plasmid replication protein RepL domain-containing protein n=1 Tax=Nibrella saemangeumensis TaxID=1084526 RepID=A0ABP8N7U7_9BACT
MPTKYKKITDLPAHDENPFIDKAVKDVKIIQRQQIIHPKNRDEIQMITSSDGEVTGYSAFMRYIEVDEEKFAKLYISQLTAFWELNKQAMRVFSYILTVIKPKQDTFLFEMDECLKYTGYASEQSVFLGLTALIEAGIIARSNRHYKYFINPLVVFNGDRVAFTKMYVKKKKEKDKGSPNQLDLFQSEPLKLE